MNFLLKILKWVHAYKVVECMFIKEFLISLKKAVLFIQYVNCNLGWAEIYFYLCITLITI